MNTLVRRGFLVFLIALTAPATQAQAAARTAQDCRVLAGLAGDVHSPTMSQALGMYNCINGEISKVDKEFDFLMRSFRKWREEHEGLLIAGGGRLLARTCKDEKTNRRYIEGRLGDVKNLRSRVRTVGKKFEALYQGFMIELNVVFLGTPGGANVLGRFVKGVNDDLRQRSDEIEREQKGLKVFYVDLQQTRFQEVCGGTNRRNQPPVSNACKWQTRRAFNAARGRYRTSATGYVCVCPPANVRSNWPAAKPDRCGPYPTASTQGSRTAPHAAPPAAAPPAPPASSGGGWKPIQ
jgi:hypothetical protein